MKKHIKLISIMFAISIGTIIGLSYYPKPEPLVIPDCICPEIPKCPNCHLECVDITCSDCTPTLNCTMVCPKCPSSSRVRDYEYIEKIITVEGTTTIPITTIETTTITSTTMSSTTSTTTVCHGCGDC